jgi:hypothetical protein
VREPHPADRARPPAAPAAPVPPARAPAAPQVTDLSWRNMTPTLARDPPCCGDAYSISCGVRDAEGDPVAVSVELRAANGVCPTAERCWKETRIFPTSDLPFGMVFRVDKVANVAMGGSVLTCQAIDSHGFTSTLTSCIPLPPSRDCP